MSNVSSVLALFLVFILLISSIRIFKSQFTSFLILTIFIVSVYAVVRTGFYSFYSFYLFCFLAWIGYDLVTKRFKFTFSFNFSDVGFALIIWFLFALVYLNFTNFYILHPGNSLDDISVYSRIAYYNDFFGVENTRGIYNLFDATPRLELYHHFELWMMNFGHSFNGANRSMNLLLFVFPVISYLCYLGIRETFNLKSWPTLALFLIFLLVIWPYDLLANWLNLGLPKGGVGATILEIKNVLVLPILLTLVYEIRQKSTQFYLTATSLFLYPLLIPLISVSLITYIFFFSKNSIKHLWVHFGLILLILAFMAFIPNSHPGLDLLGIFNKDIFLKIIFVSVVTPLISFGFYWILFIRNVGFGKVRDLILFFSICLIFSIIFWLFFIKNIDSNQFFRNLFIPLCSFSISYGIVFFYSKKAYLFALIGLVIFVIPVFSMIGKSTMNHPSDELLSIVENLEEGDRILFFPDAKVVNSVFMYNERMFLTRDVSQISNFLKDIHVLGTASLLNSKAVERNEIAKEMIDYYKELSPIFQNCGNSTAQELCIKDFAIKNNFRKALIHKNSPFASAFEANFYFENYIIVNLF